MFYHQRINVDVSDCLIKRRSWQVIFSIANFGKFVRKETEKSLLVRESYKIELFEIESRCGGHSVTKKFMTILQILVAKPK